MAHHEPHAQSTGGTLNWLRAAVLGANDGIVSVSSIVVGVAGASDSAAFILTAGVAGLVAGALSMAVGEYVSVSTQRDTEKALLEKERAELREYPQQELEELAGLYEMKGLSKPTARTVAEELMAHDAFAAHAEAELHIDPNDLTNPWQAALASAASFSVGGIVPILAVALPARCRAASRHGHRRSHSAHHHGHAERAGGRSEQDQSSPARGSGRHHRDGRHVRRREALRRYRDIINNRSTHGGESIIRRRIFIPKRFGGGSCTEDASRVGISSPI